MLNALQEKQRRLVSSLENVDYVRKEYHFINSDERLIGLIGSRGVGKTTLLLQYIKQFNLDEALYFSADDMSIVNFGIIEIVEEFYKLGGRIVVIDEVHRFREWAGHVKNIYDFFPDLIIRISGSSMLNILMQSYDLSRRILIKELDKLSFKEYFEIKNGVTLSSFTFEEILENHVTLSYELITKHPTLYKQFTNYLKMGCYPYFLSSKNEENYYAKLYNSLEKIIYEDIPSTNKIKFESLDVFKKLMYKIVAAQTPYKVVIDSLSKELKISEPTLYTYLDILNKTGLFTTVKKFSKKESRKPEKLFFSNTNILFALSNDLQIKADIGTIRETFFVNSLKNAYYSDVGDFIVNGHIFEIGGKNKTFTQIKNVQESYLALDIDSSTNKKKIPLWLFDFID
ncbi:MAG: AAA family ATPase [Campylobacterales bacterium]|nr:AAA family ATPase [Campylobacterales bacterium]